MVKRSIVILAGALALAACERSAPEEPLPENDVAEEVEAPVVEDITPPAPEANVSNAVAPAAPPPAVSEEEQMLDDADAAGLTARLPDRDAENETRPAE